jgi:hypothetical protein
MRYEHQSASCQDKVAPSVVLYQSYPENVNLSFDMIERQVVVLDQGFVNIEIE